MRIFIVGTSNSVIGNKGYVKYLREKHDVVNMSIGRVPFHYHMKVINECKKEIEDSDPLVIDHYVNDINLYLESVESFDYLKECSIFYEYLSFLNVRIINQPFAILDLKHIKSLTYYYHIKDIANHCVVSLKGYIRTVNEN